MRVCARRSVLGITLSVLAVSCGTKSQGSPIDDGLSEVKTAVSVTLLNAGFEDPPRNPNEWVQSSNLGGKPPISGWQFAGLEWDHHRPISGTVYPAATEGAQYLWLGKDLTPQTTLASQAVGSILANTKYTFSVDVCPRNALSRGHIALSAMTPAQVGCERKFELATGHDFQTLYKSSGSCWTTETITFDSATNPSVVGWPLRIVLQNEKASTIFDNARLDREDARTQPFQPIPANGEVDVRVAGLQFRAGSSAAGHRVYFGTDLAKVTNLDSSVQLATPSAVACPAGTITPPACLQVTPTMTSGVQYYWRVAALNSSQSPQWLSPVWTFQVAPSQASKPKPASTTTETVGRTVRLSWTPGRGATGANPTRYEVYLAASGVTPLPQVGTPTAASFDTTQLTPDTTYNWRVDTIYPPNVRVTGPVWTFRVRGTSAAPFGNGYAVWVADATKHVFRASRPASYPAPQIDLVMAQGEEESKQLVVVPPQGKPLRRVKLELSAPTELEVDWKVVGYVRVPPYGASLGTRASEVDMAAAPDPATGGLWPDTLLPISEFDIPAPATASDPGLAQALWITVRTKGSKPAPQVPTPPGLYQGNIRILTDNGEPTDVPLKVTVQDFELAPGAGHAVTSFSLGMCKFFGPNAQADYLAYSKFLLRHRANPDDIYRNTPPTLAYLKQLLPLGLSRFTVTKSDHDYTYVKTQVNNFLANIAGDSDAPAIRERAMLYGYDEDGTCSDWEAPAPANSMRANFARLHADYPDLELLTTAHIYDQWNPNLPSNFTRTPRCPGAASMPNLGPVSDTHYYGIDFIAPNWPYYDTASADLIRSSTRSTPASDARQVWTYVWITDVYAPPLENRNIPWQMYALKIDGNIHYGVNAWTGPPLNPDLIVNDDYRFNLGLPTGQAEVLYDSAQGPIGSIRLASIRDGLEDYEYLWMLADATRDPARVRTIAKQVAPSNVTYANDFHSLWTYDSAVVNATRASVASLLRAHVDAQVMPPLTNCVRRVRVDFRNAAGNTKDWISIASTSPTMSTNVQYVAWKYTDNTTTGSPGHTTGSVEFCNLPAGKYEARLYHNNNYDIVTHSAEVVP